MAIKHLRNLLGALAVLCGLLFAGTAAASAACPTGQSFFGTIERVNGNVLTVRTPKGNWAQVSINQNARINANGTRLRPGTFVGAYGCVAPGGVFRASELTLSLDRNAYNEQLSGVVRRIEGNDRMLVQENGHGYGVWYVPDTGDFHVGQTVNAVGMVGAGGVFYPQTINGVTTAYDADDSARRNPGTISLTGIVRAVRVGSLLVWEPQHGTTGTWIVRGAQRFRVGQRITARGTEDMSGRFYPGAITIL